MNTPQQPLFPPTQPSTPRESQMIDLELRDEAQPHTPNYAEDKAVSEPFPPPSPLNHHPRSQRPHPSKPEWLSLVMSFSFTAMSMSFQSIRTPNQLPLSCHMAGLGLVLALAAFVLSKYIPAFLGRGARLLEGIGVFFGVTAFMLDLTLFFPLYIKVISWAVYVTALLALILFPLLRDRM